MRFFDETVGYFANKKKQVPVEMRSREHNPPHVHVEIDGTSGLFEIKDGSQWRGNVKSKHLALIKAWILANRAYLKREWNKRNPSLHMDEFLRRYRMSDSLCCTSDSMRCPSHSIRIRFSRQSINSVSYRDALIDKLTQKCIRSIQQTKLYRKMGVDISDEIRHAKKIIKTIACL